MDLELQTLGVQLAETTIRNTAASIADRVATVRARKKDQETIVELEEIVNGLLSDKSELVRIAHAYEQELVAQKISAPDIEYISTNIVPLVQQLVESTATTSGQDATSMRATIELIQRLLSVETVTVLQLIGFNFRAAIGEPLTELVSRLISSKAAAEPAVAISGSSARQRRR